MRLLILIHRYVGMLIGLVIVLWCLSGFVMMYVQYPEHTRAEQLASLDRINTGDCCVLPSEWSDDLEITGALIESFLGDPILRLWSGGADWAINLTNGQNLIQIDTRLAREIVGRHAKGAIRSDRLIEHDQWTVAGGYDRHRPLYHFAIDDDSATELYVSGTTGQIVLQTSGTERFWNWLGSVVHWIYPTKLRSNIQLWSQLVIWLSILATFLTLIGIYIGIARFRRGNRSPYRGWLLWHHYLGLIFGVFTLTWIISGLLSMTPFGALSGRDFSPERKIIRGRDLTIEQVVANLPHTGQQSIPADTVRLSASMFAGEFAWIAWNSVEQPARLGMPINANQLAAQASLARPHIPIQSAELLHKPDAYYYSHHAERRFPVFRVIYEDGDRLYLDSSSGELISGVDSDRRWSRWLFHALHRGDFAAWARERPTWDFFMWFLMTGVTLGSLTGAYLGYKRACRWLISAI